MTVDYQFNQAEMDILLQLVEAPRVTNISSDGINRFTVYISNLSKYFSSSGVSLSKEKAAEIQKLIQGRNDLLSLENVNDINKMSLDGRKLIIYIYEKIYELSGLYITFDAEYSIEKIESQYGDILYLNSTSEKQPVFRVEVLVITLSFILSLVTLCFIIAKKNQIIVKGGSYDGFDEKEYA
jgi:hypothetical protein